MPREWTRLRKGAGVFVVLCAGGCAAPSVTTPPVPAPQPPAAAPQRAAAAPAPQTATPSPQTDAPAPPDDVWQRIRTRLELPRGPHADIEREIAWFRANPDFLERVATRARPMLHHVVEEVERRRLPIELALLPVVESAFQVRAYSPGHASGPWQFIAATARRFGLEHDWWYDGRRDIVASTRAALDYLEILHRHFDDWELAIAAYNCGERTVARARAHNGRRGRPTDFWSLELPAETRAFLPRLLAVAEVVADPERYGQRLTPIPDAPYFTVIDAGRALDLRAAARAAGVDADEFADLNAGYLRGVTAPDGPQTLLVPIAAAERFERALAEVPDAELQPWHRHRIRSGETLSGIAARYGTTVRALQRANRLRGSFIRAGQDLLVPTGTNAETASAGDGARTAAPAASPAPRHRVRQGDNLWAIARRYGVTVEQLVAWNDIRRDALLAVDQELIVRDPQRSRDGVDTITDGRLRYRVRRGDSLWAIARRFDVGVDELRRWNDLPARGHLQPGQELEIRVSTVAGDT